MPKWESSPKRVSSRETFIHSLYQLRNWEYSWLNIWYSKNMFYFRKIKLCAVKNLLPSLNLSETFCSSRRI